MDVFCFNTLASKNVDMRSVGDLLRAVKDGRVDLRKAEQLLKLDAIAVIGEVARVDYNRYLRRGVPEIIYGKSKTTKQLMQILGKLIPKWEKSPTPLPIIVSKLDYEKAHAIILALKRRKTLVVRYYDTADLMAIAFKKHPTSKTGNERVALLAAGTSDMQALNEAEIVLNIFGCRTIRYNDVGVAGLHRLIKPLNEIVSFAPDAIIVAAGMEGALPSVIAGLSSVPVIGLPTSVGYGYGGNGEAALMSMLQACSLGVCVVNIDAGVAAGVIAWLIVRRNEKSY